MENADYGGIVLGFARDIAENNYSNDYAETDNISCANAYNEFKQALDDGICNIKLFSN